VGALIPQRSNIMKGLVAATIASLMLAASPLALAQVQTPPSPNAQVQTPPSPNAQAQTPPSPNAQMQWYSHQASELRASKLIGTSVKNKANESIGSINEVVLDKDGKVAAVVIGVGGFLGMGEHEVAVNFSSLRLSDDGNGKTLVTVDATKDALKAAPQWTWASGDRAKTTGTSSKPMNPSK
jgi:sporulation protein YlmC with PRC-barrel domain